MRLGVCIPAAGSGKRMGGAAKPFLQLAGEPLLLHALRPFLALPEVQSVVVALPAAEAAAPPPWLTGVDVRVRVVGGGETRFGSVHAALAALDSGIETVAVHDAARPLLTREVVERCLEAALAGDGEGVVAGWPATDTLKEVEEGGWVVATPDRARFWAAQTPQLFPRAALQEAYRRGAEARVEATDDAAVFAQFGGRVRMVRGDPWNLKVTVPEDLPLAELLLRARSAIEEIG